MDWQAQSAALLQQIERAAGGPVLVIGALAIALLLLFALIVLADRHRRLVRDIAAERQQAVGRAAAPPPEPQGEPVRTSIDRVLLLNPVAFYLLVAVLSAGCWLAGWAIAPSKARFLASREWHIQPFYLAAHLIALRLFVSLFLRKYVAGAAQLDIPAEQIAAGIRRVLGPAGALVAVAIAAPFCALDYRYLVSDRYEKLSEDQALYAIDYLMWGIWCAEWLLNAMMWVTLAGFLAMSYRALRTSRFRAPIATVVQDKLYRPFLQMSSQGASIVLGFACVTAFYIWYAGGVASDFLGLAVTGVLLVVGFVPSWLLLNAKVKRTVREEIEALRRNVPAPVAGESMLVGASVGRGGARTVEERLDEVVALMRAWHLERLQLDVGRNEAQALAVRLAAPAATAGWQFYNNLQGILGNVGRTIGSIFSTLGGLFM
jgi:hypothetical protein